MRTLIVLCCALWLAGCGGPTGNLEPPAASLLVPPRPLQDLKAGDDLVQKHAELRRDSATDKSKLTRLQRWVKTVLKK